MIDCQASQTLRFQIQRYEDIDFRTVIFQFAGPCTARHIYASTSPAALRSLLESIPGGPQSTTHIFDLTRVPYMDSTGLGVIVDHYLQNHPKGIQIMAIGLSPRVFDRFKSARKENLFPMTAD
ncbi:MAG TPA: STAS domain-containing protein [Terracidiphilus sp.]|jgi:anti-anti-sigma factor